MPTTDRPLTDLQERVLIGLHEYGGSTYVEAQHVQRGLMRAASTLADEADFERWRKTEATTVGRALGALHEKGLVDRQWSGFAACWNWRINDDGVAMLDSMGD